MQVLQPEIICPQYLKIVYLCYSLELFVL